MTLQLAGVVLAAGEGRRFGGPKQLAVWRNKTLLEHVVAAVGSCCDPVVVVTGAYVTELEPVFAQMTAVTTVHNSDWRAGVGSSLRKAVQTISPIQPAGMMITHADQPHLHAGLLGQLIELWLTAPENPVAAAYGSTLGVPAIYPQNLFKVLSHLDAGHGGKALLASHPALQTVNMPQAADDVDTLADLKALEQNY